jgi:hypothetical protein
MTLPFSLSMKQSALARQKNYCASCGTKIHALGMAGAATHQFGESSEAHHAYPHKLGGPNTTENCVVICRACHLNAHQGGAWRDISIYRDIVGPMPQRVAQASRFYKFYRGR